MEITTQSILDVTVSKMQHTMNKETKYLHIYLFQLLIDILSKEITYFAELAIMLLLAVSHARLKILYI